MKKENKTTVEEKAICVFDFSQYWKYLESEFNWAKSQSNSFSLSKLAMKLGLNHKTTALRLIQGQIKALTTDVIDSISDLYKHTPNERLYFRYLVAFNEATSLEQKNHFHDKMHKIIRPQRRVHLSSQQESYFAEWYYPVIKEIVSGIKDPVSLKEIQNKLIERLPINEISKALEVMLDIGVLVKKNDQWEVLETNLILHENRVRKVLQNFHISHNEILQNRLKSQQQLKKLFGNTITFGIPEERVNEFQKKMKIFYQEMMDFGSAMDDAKNSVWQFSMYLYPMTKTEEV